MKRRLRCAREEKLTRLSEACLAFELQRAEAPCLRPRRRRCCSGGAARPSDKRTRSTIERGRRGRAAHAEADRTQTATRHQSFWQPHARAAQARVQPGLSALEAAMLAWHCTSTHRLAAPRVSDAGRAHRARRVVQLVRERPVHVVLVRHREVWVEAEAEQRLRHRDRR
eukprot:752113-Pleurochrysis_carterae.AAC.2